MKVEERTCQIGSRILLSFLWTCRSIRERGRNGEKAYRLSFQGLPRKGAGGVPVRAMLVRGRIGENVNQKISRRVELWWGQKGEVRAKGLSQGCREGAVHTTKKKARHLKARSNSYPKGQRPGPSETMPSN